MASVFSDVSSTLSATRSAIGGFVDEVATLLDAESHHEGPGKPLHTAAVVFNLSNTTMGVGILSLAATYSYSGIVFGPVIMVLCAIATYYSIFLMVRVVNSNRIPADASQIPTMEAMCEYALGRFGRLWVQVVLIMICLGTLVAYLVSVKSLFYEGLKEIFPDAMGNTDFVNDNTAMLSALILVAFPLSCLRNIDGLWFTSFLSVMSIGYFVILSIAYWATHSSDSEKDPCHEMVSKDDDPVNASLPTGGVNSFPTSVTEMLQAFSIISMSYICQLTVFPILKELAKGQKVGGADVPVQAAGRQLNKAMAVTMCIACTMYVAAGVSGYATWQSVTTKPTTILACYPTDNPAVAPAYFCMTLCLLFSFPLIAFTARVTITNIMYPDHEAGPVPATVHYGLTAALTVPCALLAVVAKSLTTVLGVVSAITSPSLCFLIPGVSYVRVAMMEREHGLLDDGSPRASPGSIGVKLRLNDDSTVRAPRNELETEFITAERTKLTTSLAPGYFMIAVGSFMQVACTVAAVSSFL